MMSMMMYLISLFFFLNFMKKYSLIYLVYMLFILMFYLMFYLINLKFYNFWMFIYMDFGIEKISLLMILLSLWLIILMLMTIFMINLNYLQFLIKLKIFLLISLMLFFFSMDLIKFYLFFEISLIPILMMILGWGIQPERLYAGFYLLMYTLFASLPFFIMMMFMKLNLFTMNMILLNLMNLMENNFLLYFFLMFIFLIKLPIYIIHLWLPKAHVEAPIFGSMVLAGILLKLGSYGILRFMYMYMHMMYKYNLYLMIYVFIGSINISIMCLRQIDLKMMIAYSSIVHMGFMLVGMLTMYELSMIGGVLMMIGHGLCSSGLFCLLNFNYIRINSRSMILNKGMSNYFLNMNLWWFLMCIMNMAAPPSLNLFSEILLMMSILKFNMKLIILIILISFFSGAYSIYMYSFIQHGKNYFMLYNFKFMFISEYLLIIMHWIPMNFLFLNLVIFI